MASRRPIDAYDTHVENRYAVENVFPGMERDATPLPSFTDARPKLPQPLWHGHDDAIRAYWRAWEIAFSHLRTSAENSGLIANYIDTAFNDCTFMWDSVFMTMFGRYGARAFNFQRTLDNFYACQHKDGFICREIRVRDGADRFERFDPTSTGPNIMPWCEWEYYLQFGDQERLSRVFAPLMAYTQWTAKHRTWPDGSYWSSGWGCGMDNLPRQRPGFAPHFDHGQMSWIDAVLQAILSEKTLVRMAVELKRSAETESMQNDIQHLSDYVNQHMWDNTSAMYFDRYRDGSLSDVKMVGAFWALLAEVVPPARLQPFIAHLENPKEFNRPHRIPALSADHPAYQAEHGYWNGSVWTPTNYMVLRGLTRSGKDDLAHEIACCHVDHVVKVATDTGTFWENYSAEKSLGQGGKDFIGWTGLPPIAVLFEYVFGLRAVAGRRELLWDIRLLDEHGVKNYPFGPTGMLNLKCAARVKPADEPQVSITGSTDLTVVVQWAGGRKIMKPECPAKPA